MSMGWLESRASCALALKASDAISLFLMVTLGCSFWYPAMTAATWEEPGAPVHVQRFRLTGPLLPVPPADGVEELEEHAASAPALPANRAETAASPTASRL